MTKPLALTAILAGGGIIHRAGSAETILLFTNHRNCLTNPNDWQSHVDTLRAAAPEKQIIVEADDYQQALLAIDANADIVQLDKLPVEQIQQLQRLVNEKSLAAAYPLQGALTCKPSKVSLKRASHYW